MHTTALSSSFLFFTPSYARSFISMLMQRKRRGRGYFDKRNAGGFSNVHTADSCYFWELGDVFVRPVRGLTVHCLDTFGVYFTTRTCVEGRWISIFFFFFIYIFRFEDWYSVVDLSVLNLRTRREDCCFYFWNQISGWWMIILDGFKGREKFWAEYYQLLSNDILKFVL